MKRHKLLWLVLVAIISVILVIACNNGVKCNNAHHCYQTVYRVKECNESDISNLVKIEPQTVQSSSNIKQVEASQNKSGIVSYVATPQIGYIGFSKDADFDNPVDNIFEFVVNDINVSNRVWLSYEVFGLADVYGICRSINDRLSYGGYMYNSSDTWLPVKEEINPQWLKTGVNRVIFTKLQGGLNYTIKNLHVIVEEATPQDFTLSSPAIITDNGIYIHGFVTDNIKSVLANDCILTISDNEIETFIDKNDVVNITLVTKDDTRLQRVIKPIKKNTVNLTTFNRNIKYTNKKFSSGNSDSILLASTVLKIDSTNISRNLNLSITSLRDNDIPPLNYGMSNVTAEDAGYRFLPHGTHFENDGASISLKYDRTKIPSGYTEADIRTFYFDTEKKQWLALEKIALDTENLCIVSKTTHFTDMINGVIQLPESPETEGFVPTMMNDIKIADPASGITLISPPVANNRGSANLQYPIELPPARNGHSPSLFISYNSDALNGWLGEGWDIQIPSITVDTRWGVPLYSSTHETETYLLNGVMLCTANEDGNMIMSHRDTSMARIPDRQFIERTNNSFSRIIRKGDSPNNYYWEITDKNGTIYTYGNYDNSKLKSSLDSTIAEWKIASIVNVYGDYIKYYYKHKTDTIYSSLESQALYLDSICVGSGNSVPHTIICFKSNNAKNVKLNSARYGFLTTSNELLSEIVVVFRGETFRKYDLKYVDGVWNKNLLSQITLYGVDDNIISSHNFDYHNDIVNGLYSGVEEYNVHLDNYTDGLSFGDISSIDNFYSVSYGGNIYAGAGVNDNLPLKSSTVGISVAYNGYTSRGVSSLMDINGDGLVDKVYKSGDSIYYRPQVLDDNDSTSFGNSIKINGINNISTSNSNSINTGIKIHNLIAAGGGDYSYSIFKTTGYFADVNADGISDFVTDKKVLFGYLEDDSIEFSHNSNLTDNPIQFSGNVDNNIINVLADSTQREQEEYVKNSPMLDAVRVWKAPKEGRIVILGSVKLLTANETSNEEYNDADGVVTSIQVGNDVLWSNIFNKNNSSSVSYRQVVDISKGDTIFFRVQSGSDSLSNGNLDRVEWSPEIRYIPKIVLAEDSLKIRSFDPIFTLDNPISWVINPNGDYENVFYASESNVYSSNSTSYVPDSIQGLDGSYVTDSLKFNNIIIKPQTTDDVTFCIYSVDSLGSKQILWNRTFLPTEILEDTTLHFAMSKNDILYNLISYEISSPSNVRWQDIKWIPSVILSSEQCNATDTIQGAVKYKTYSNLLQVGSYAEVIEPSYLSPLSSEESLEVTSVTPVSRYYLRVIPNINIGVSNNYNENIRLTIKSNNKIYGYKDYYLTSGGFVKKDTIDIPLPNVVIPDTLQVWCEFFVPKKTGLNYIYKAEAEVQVITNKNWLGDVLSADFAKSNVFTCYDNEAMGTLYRGWGAFAYNAGHGRYAKPIVVDSLNLNHIEDEFKDIDIQNTDSYSGPVLNAHNFPLYSLNVNNTTNDSWTGPHENFLIADSVMSSARLSIQNVKVNNPLDAFTNISRSASEYPGIPIIAKNHSIARLIGSGLLSKSIASSSGSVDLTYMDMNGDGYPDIVTNNKIQYTNFGGGLSNRTSNEFLTPKSIASSDSWCSGGDPIAAYSFVAGMNNYTNSKSTENQISNENTKGAINIGANINRNEDSTQSTYLDINGDGLPDWLDSEKEEVRLNLGYTFGEKFSITLGVIQRQISESKSLGIGGAFNICASSISGGINYATTTTNTKSMFIDINGDGLVDKIYTNNNQQIIVDLNTGNGFSTSLIWSQDSLINESISTSSNLNISYSIAIPLLMAKLAFGVGISVGTSNNATNFVIRDFDGDGYLDIINSKSSNIIQVQRSAIRRSNKLKSVSNSLGGKFYLDYNRSRATTDHPGGKWVMSHLTIDDGIYDDGPLMQTKYEYNNGKHDRYEREFLGFGQVITHHLNTDSTIYRSVTQEFDVSNYYVQGNILSSSVSDATNNLYSKESNEYYSYGVTASGNQYSVDAMSPTHNSIYTPLKYTKQESYEGGNAGIIMSESWSGYKVGSNSFGELTTYKYSDKGSLGSSGTGEYDFVTNVEYENKISDSTYIWGLPSSITVIGNGNNILRSSLAQYNNKGDLIKYTQYLNNDSAVTNYEYDNYGNIIKRILPANNEGQQMFYSYTYDASHMYVTSIADAYGYNSTLTNYDYRYGIPLKHTDINGRETTYTIDDFGRITSVLSPIDKPDVEIDGYSPYTIKFEYANAQINDNGEISQPARAITYHFNKFTDDTVDYDIMTVAFCDGFGRNIQVQKEAIVGNVSGQSTHAMIVSGRTKYDAFGRVIESYYPTSVNYNDNFNFISTFDNITPTVTEYDVLDRATQNTLPDNTITSYNYNIDSSTRSIVTTITDANDNISKTYTNGSGKTVKTEQFENSNTAIPTTFEYDGIGQLVKVTDAEGNITTSTYDMGGRVTQVTHPASGTSSYTYDKLGNVISKQTSNMTGSNVINYNYHFTRLSSVEYPNNPENNISLLYGSSNENNSKGRVLIKTDGSGATEYEYDELGNITYERRSVVVPNNGIYTFVTQYSYDSFNRLGSMTYPDGEIVFYNYDAGGNVSSVTHNKDAGESNYVDQILYDKFNNRTYMKYGNGIISTYSYDPLRCRLSNMTAGDFINKIYQYDAVSNITKDSSASGGMNHAYSYDNLYRLVTANGVYSGADNKTASYNLSMGYDNMHRITSKQQFLTQENVQFDGTLYAGYNMSYTYDDNKKFQLSTISDNNYRSVSTPIDSVYNTHTYQYDANGNLTYVATGRRMKDGHTEDLISERKLLWDDENRLMAISDNGYVSTYRYDDAGNRTVKLSGHGEAVFVNGSESGSIFTQTDRFTAYPNPYMVYNGSRYYKHIYVGSERIVSKVSANNPDYDPRQEACAGNSLTGYTVKLQSQQQALSDSIASIYAKLEVPYYPNNNDDYDYNWSDGLRRSVANPDSYGEFAYFYHSDYLGSTSYVTDATGAVSQHVEYVPFGEVFIEERNNTWNTPYLFNAKELDEETGLYYYGARYYDPRTSLWLSTDPLELKYPNVSTYAYCLNNPIKLVDLWGFEPTEEEAARMADYVYGNGSVILTGGWIESKNNYGISMDHSRSGFKSQLFERTIDGVTEYTYAFAGTDFTSLDDWGNNISQLLGSSEQYSIAMYNAEVLVRELKNQELTFVGHSLGGGLAAASAYATNGRAMTFNAAGVSPLTVNKTSKARIDAYITRRDELHLFQSTMKLPTADGTKHWRNSASNVLGHSIENFYKPNLLKRTRDWFFEQYVNFNNSLNSIFKP